MYFRSHPQKDRCYARSVEDAPLKNPAEELSKLDIVFSSLATRGRAMHLALVLISGIGDVRFRGRPARAERGFQGSRAYTQLAE